MMNPSTEEIENHLTFLKTVAARWHVLKHTLLYAITTFDDVMAHPEAGQLSFEHLFIWHTQVLNPTEYARKFGDLEFPTSLEAIARSLTISVDTSQGKACDPKHPIIADIKAQIPFMRWAVQKPRNVAHATTKYEKFLELHRRHPQAMLVPTKEIDLIWHTHMRSPREYRARCMQVFGHVLSHDDKIGDLASAIGFRDTRDLWWKEFGEAYEKDRLKAFFQSSQNKTYATGNILLQVAVAEKPTNLISNPCRLSYTRRRRRKSVYTLPSEIVRISSSGHRSVADSTSAAALIWHCCHSDMGRASCWSKSAKVTRGLGGMGFAGMM